MGENRFIIRYIKILLLALLIGVPIYLLANQEEPDISVTAEPTEVVTEEVVEEVAITPLADRTPEEILTFFTTVLDVNRDLAHNIIMCESGIRGNKEIADYQRTQHTLIKNVISSASGYWQFINGTWRSTMYQIGLPTNTDKHDRVVSIAAGVWLLGKDGTGHWSESRPCWSKRVQTMTVQHNTETLDKKLELVNQALSVEEAGSVRYLLLVSIKKDILEEISKAKG